MGREALKIVENLKETLKIVVVGHVDHGKSTLIGRLLYDTKSLPEGAIEKVKRISKEKGKPFEYAYLLDAFEEEQKQGITIDTTQLQFFTEKRDYIIIDAPGHKEFLKNMISGAANAEAAILMVDAQEGIQEQSKRHGYILSLLGIRKVYVIVNKMDLIDYSQEQFNQIRDDFNQFLGNLNVHPLKYIPVSAFLGENITTLSDQMPWYQDLPVLAALDAFEKEKGQNEKPLRFPIQDVYKFDSRRIIAGRIEAGTLKVGDTILISPGQKTTTVKSIEHWAERDRTDGVFAGMSVGITVADEFFNKRGQFISHLNNPPLVSNIFKANLFWMGKSNLVTGKKYKLKLTTQEVECEIQSIEKVIDASTLDTLVQAKAVAINDVAEVIIKTKQPVAFDPFGENQTTGRFVLVDGYDVSGGGIISAAEAAQVELEEAEGTQGSVTKLVTREEREHRDNQKGQVIWIAGSDRGTILEFAAKLEKELFELRKRTYYLDSDTLQAGINADLAYSDTEELTRRKAEVAKLFIVNGIYTIITSDSNKEDLTNARLLVGEADFVEVDLTNINAGQIDDKLNTTINQVISA